MPPLNFISSGQLSGMEPDLLAEWANRRGWKLEYLIMDFASQMPAILTGKADIAMGYISVTEERQKTEVWEAIQHPNYFGASTGGSYAWYWTAAEHGSFWSTTKTIYDPSPVGYRVPSSERV